MGTSGVWLLSPHFKLYEVNNNQLTNFTLSCPHVCFSVYDEWWKLIRSSKSSWAYQDRDDDALCSLFTRAFTGSDKVHGMGFLTQKSEPQNEPRPQISSENFQSEPQLNHGQIFEEKILEFTGSK